MSDARDEVLAIYRSCGLEKSESWTVGEDHVAVELEFMGVLAHRRRRPCAPATKSAPSRSSTPSAISWTTTSPAGCRCSLAIPGRFADTTFYQALANVTEGFLEEDAALLADLVAA